MIGDDKVPKLRAGDLLTQSFLEKLLAKVNRQSLQPGSYTNGAFSVQRQIGTPGESVGGVEESLVVLWGSPPPIEQVGDDFDTNSGPAQLLIPAPTETRPGKHTRGEVIQTVMPGLQQLSIPVGYGRLAVAVGSKIVWVDCVEFEFTPPSS